jgi:DNA-binding SARP family transcriptional activator/tetratricopeptide (TPR) repeat protein
VGRTQFSLLGPLVVRRAGVVVPVTAGKHRALLAALLLQAGRPVGVDELAEVLWESKMPRSARATLQTYVGRLRTLLEHDGDSVIVTEAAGYRIDAGPNELDVAGFESALAAGRAAIRVESWAKASAMLAEGLALWRGSPLAGVPSDVLAQREVPRLSELRTQAMEARIEADLRLGRHAEMILELRQLVAAEPLRERLHALLMTALYRDGQQSGALEAYQAARAMLIDELGVEPGPELRQLQERILAVDPALLPGTAPLAAVEVQARPGAVAASPRQNAEACQPSRRTAEVRYSLPPDPATFSGRASELDSIVGAAASGGTGAIWAIGGMPGIGKTTLAVHAAHLLQGRFPDRQLFIDLRGRTPGLEPLSPEAALASLLADTGVDPQSLPGDLTARTSLWRDRMAGQRALLVLDNAASSAQVAPLLPGGAQCQVLITSRRHLADLPGAVTPLFLQTLARDEARLMFVRLAPRAASEADAPVTELVELAGFLPLAISLLARMFNRHPSWSLADLTTETRARLLTLTAERDNVAAVFEMSCQDLDPAVRQFFWRLGLHPGVTIDTFSAAAVAGVPVTEAIEMLDLLQGEGLLTETKFRRYGMHDLIRRYARERAAAETAAAADEQAVSRLLDYYQHTAARANSLLARQIRTIPPAAVAAVPAAAPVLANSGQALAWARAERANLLACIDYATAQGQDRRVVALTAGAAALLHQDGSWTEAMVRHAAAAEAARRIDDKRGRADALGSLGTICRLAGDVPGASQALTEALGLFQDLGDEHGQADALTDLGEMLYSTSDYAGAARLYGKVLKLSRHLGERFGQARVLRRLGAMRWRTGDYERASQALTQARVLYRGLGDRLGQAAVLSDLGSVRRDTGDLTGAIGNLEEALAAYRDLGSRLGEAFALNSLGVTRRKAGDYPGAARELEQALAVYRETGDRGGYAETLNELGTLHRARGDALRSRESHRQALRVARDIGSPHDEACALAGLARLALDADDIPSAVAGLRRARRIFEQSGAAERADIAAELAALPPAEHSPH